MLQPGELHDVSQRFADQIATLRNFFLQAGVPIGSTRALSEVVSRVASDRPFHRDLVSHLWVLLDESGPGIRSADLLGMVTIAAAGKQAAAEMGEEEAHTLLRFLMEVRHTLEATHLQQPASSASPIPSPRALSSEAAQRRNAPLRLPTDLREQPQGSPASSSVAKDHSQPAVPQSRTHRGLVFGALGVCAAALLCVLYFALHRQGLVQPGNAVSSGVAGTPIESGGTSASLEGRETLSHSTPPERAGRSLRDSSAIAPSTAELSAIPSPEPSSAAPVIRSAPGAATMTSVNAGVVSKQPQPGSGESLTNGRMLPNTEPAARPQAQAASILPRTAASGGHLPTIVSADSLSRQLDSPKLPAYASAAEELDRTRYPRLLRRHAAEATRDTGADPELSAELRAPDLGATLGVPRPSAAPTLPHGTVRSTCVGMMAGNLVYGPAPPYPSVAAASRVQGEVKIQATIDRDGTINSARVISGPPLLRDAALDAVQRWRYKPYLASGKPAPTGTMAVVDFELQ